MSERTNDHREVSTENRVSRRAALLGVCATVTLGIGALFSREDSNDATHMHNASAVFHAKKNALEAKTKEFEDAIRADMPLIGVNRAAQLCHEIDAAIEDVSVALKQLENARGRLLPRIKRNIADARSVLSRMMGNKRPHSGSSFLCGHLDRLVWEQFVADCLDRENYESLPELVSGVYNKYNELQSDIMRMANPNITVPVQWMHKFASSGD